MKRYLVIFEKTSTGYSAYVPDLQGCIATGRTKATTEKQIFEAKIAPLFDHKILRAILRSPTSLYGLGIPPAQYDALVADHEQGLTGALRQRLSRLACDFPIGENYFAQQAFGHAQNGTRVGCDLARQMQRCLLQGFGRHHA